MSLITMGLGPAVTSGGSDPNPPPVLAKPPPPAGGVTHAIYPPMPTNVGYLKVPAPPGPRGVIYG